ncbi:ABC transporter permease [Nonomuraea sp. NPDC049028]|uniref:ABC transporter permease n=1 Tax=Nonomuraea sp. NPDC049028 TaxID=3364348 RepID=UPI003718CCF3
MAHHTTSTDPTRAAAPARAAQSPLDGGKGRLRRTVRTLARRTIPLLVVAAAWAAISRLATIDPLFLPSPGLVWNAFTDMAPLLPGAIAYSMGTLLTGFAAGCAAAILLGLAMAYSKIIRYSIEGLVDALRPVPVFALIPLFMLWLGIGRPPQVLLVAFGCFVIVVVSTSEAIRNVPAIFMNAASTLGASRARVYRTVVVPAITPQILGGVRAAGSAAFGLEVAAELIGAQDGLGHMMITNQLYLRTEGILVAIAVFTLLALILDAIIRFAGGRLVRWSGRGPA